MVVMCYTNGSLVGRKLKKNGAAGRQEVVVEVDDLRDFQLSLVQEDL